MLKKPVNQTNQQMIFTCKITVQKFSIKQESGSEGKKLCPKKCLTGRRMQKRQRSPT